MNIHERPVAALTEVHHPEIARISIFRSKEETALAAAYEIARVPRENPEARITFATGNTMEPVLKNLAWLKNTGYVDFSRITASHLDAYFPENPDQDEFSFVKFLRELAWGPLGIQTVHELNGMAADPHAEAARYEALLRENPVDLAILGIGPWSSETQTGCHIAFNESGTKFELGTHLQKLDITTVQRDQIDRGQTSPEYALTQGISTIGEAKSILLVAYGEGKGLSLREALYGQVGPQRPASALRQFGHKVTIMADMAAARMFA